MLNTIQRVVKTILEEVQEEVNDVLDRHIERIVDADIKTPCSLCRFRNEDTGICDMCPAMPLERGAE